MGCLYYGLYLYSNHSEPSPHDGIFITYKVAPYQCGWQHCCMVCLYIYLLWGANFIYTSIVPIWDLHFHPKWRRLGVEQTLDMLTYARYMYAMKFQFGIPVLSCVLGLQDNIYLVIYTLMSTWYFWFTIILVPLVALSGDLLFMA